MSQFVGAFVAQTRPDSKQCVLIKCESQKRHNESEQHSKDLWAREIEKRRQSFYKMLKSGMFVCWTHKS